ncbi:MAG: DUF721 domain-containing protein [Pseudomonadota bacterium]
MAQNTTSKPAQPTRRKDAPKGRRSTTYGFAQTGGLLAKRIAGAAQARGFAQMRLVTQWAEIVGAELAALCTPERVSFGKGGMGGTLTVRTTGALAPAVDMSRETLRARVNTCYGYNAISRIRIQQVGHMGFAEPQRPFQPKSQAPQATPRTSRDTQAVVDAELRAALELLGGHVARRRPPVKPT